MTLARTLIAILLAVLTVGRAAAADPGLLASQDAPARPGRLIVKYRPTVDACAHCLLKRQVPFATVTGNDSLDRLHQRLGVRGARSLFVERHGLAGDAASAAARDRLARVRARFPLRTARARGAAPTPDLSNVYVLELPPDVDVHQAAALYAADPDVEYAEPDYEVHATFVPNDPFFSSVGTWGQSYPDLWGLHLTRADEAWDTANGSGTVVAVVDTGVDGVHPDLVANMWTNPGEIPANGIDDDGNGFVDDVHGWDFVADDADPADENGHGTHCAGIVAATGDNGIGVVGMAWGAQIMAVRGLDANGFGSNSALAQGLVYATDNGADVLSNSWIGPPNSLLADAVSFALGMGAVVVAGAGNDSGQVDSKVPASLPGVIAVGAVGDGDAFALFSNRGDAVSVTAPGVDVLSLKAPGTNLSPFVVADDYMRLSGTSMATPHVAGLAAVLFSALPGLDVDEVRWHIELNADQPGFPGYEGQPWNPFFGWGRIDAARVFDTPPVTTRLLPHSLTLHEFAGSSVPDVADARVDFTTHTPVAWTLTTPAWLAPSTASGSGPGGVGLSFDGSALAPGTYADAVAVSAPATTDAGATASATVHVHRDERIGAEIDVDVSGGVYVSGPRMASNGERTLVAWVRGLTLYAATIDDAGVVSSPVMLSSALPFADVALRTVVAAASDGDGFLVVWLERSGDDLQVVGRRLTAVGTPVDAAPIVIDSTPAPGFTTAIVGGVGFDGEAYAVLWSHGDFSDPRRSARLRVRRVRPDGTVLFGRAIAPREVRGRLVISRAVTGLLACNPGRCLFVWHQLEITNNGPEDLVYALPIVAGRPARHGTRVLTNAPTIIDIAADGTGYLVVGQRLGTCTPPGQPGLFGSTDCAIDVVAARVGANGEALDLPGIRVNDGPESLSDYRAPMGAAFDGTDYLVLFAAGPLPGGLPGRRFFIARIAPDGTVLDDEREGLLVNRGLTVSNASLAATSTHAVVAWADNRFSSDPQSFTALLAQRLLAVP